MTGKAKNPTPHETSKSEYGAKATPLTYNNYLRVRDLKNLQICQSDPAHHDEPLFIIIHQTYELWFKLILHEIDEAIRLMAADKVRRATFYLRRVVTVFRTLVTQIHILESMSPHDFLGFRSALNPASGFQSSQFREIEISCGLVDKLLMAHFRGDEESFAELRRRAEGANLRSEFYALLRRKGFDLPEPVGEEPLTPEQMKLVDLLKSRGIVMPELNNAQGAESTQNPEEAAEMEGQRLQQLRKLYERSDDFPDLHDLAEVLMDIDEHIFMWRSHHVTVVERVIGFKRGTGGSEGVAYLRSTLHKRCFPDLWNVRTVLEL
ncbi:MAG TPA: tryptophan 2,3-dioxygenase family protein [Planktothrix sp.]|jgi:tryptophan 2,3-dioxygenase